MHPNLDYMKSEWQKKGITRYFPRVHHFFSPKFKTKPSGLKAFYNWCVPREIERENTQTIARALEVVRLMDAGMSFEGALQSAWKDYPVVTR